MAMLFSQKLLEGRLQQFIQASVFSETFVFYDRGMPDVTAYMDYIDSHYPLNFSKTCSSNRYDAVFLLPPWKAIYMQDNERYESFEQAEELYQFCIHPMRTCLSLQFIIITMASSYSIGTPGVAWGVAEKQKWRDSRIIQRSYHDEVVHKIQALDGRFEVDMNFSGKMPEGIRRGMSLHIRLELGDISDETVLARGGFFQTTGGNWVFVVDNDGKYAVKRSVKLGMYNSYVFQVLEGLEPGEKVITSSYESFGNAERLILK